METVKRTNLGDLMLKHQMTLRELMTAGAPGTAVWALCLGDPVDQDRARAVMVAFNQLRSTNYTLDDVEALLCTDSEPCYLHRPKLPAIWQG